LGDHDLEALTVADRFLRLLDRFLVRAFRVRECGADRLKAYRRDERRGR
jgi:hypothetical protein